MNPDDCPYCILRLPPSSTQAQIKKAYHKLSLKMHPDKHQGNEEAYIRKFQELKEAYEFLSKPKWKAAFDDCYKFTEEGHTFDD